MNALDILSYGHKHVCDAVEGLADEAWEIPKVTTAWSVKDVIAHLASFDYQVAVGESGDSCIWHLLDPAT